MSTPDTFSIWARMERKVKWFERNGIRIVLVMLAVAAVLWFFGLRGSLISRLLQAPFYALQFIVLNKEVAGQVSEPWIKIGLYITQFAVPFFAYATFFTKLFDEHIHPKLKLKAIRNFQKHHIIISYGAFGKALVKEIKNSELIVAVEKKSASELDDKSNLTIIYCDAMQIDLTKETNLNAAQSLYLILPDERENLALLQIIKNHFASTAPPKQPLKVYLRTHSFAMQNLLMDWIGITTFKQNGLDIHISNPYAVAARGILNRYSPDLYVPTGNGPVSQVVMIVGTSEMARAMVLRFARIGTYSPKGKLRLIWVGEGVTETLHELKSFYPALDTNYDHLSCWSSDPDVSRSYFVSVLPPINLLLVDRPAEQAIRNGAIPFENNASWPAAIYVCHDSDIRNLAEARDIQSALCSKPDAACLRTYGEKGRLILAIQNGSELGITRHLVLNAFPYRIEEQSIDQLFAETVINDHADDLAKEYHAVYTGLTVKNEIDAAWMNLCVYSKESNRDLADHLAIKARYAGIDANTVKTVVFEREGSISENDADKMKEKGVFDDLADMEMYRYRAFMFMNNFRHGHDVSEYLERIETTLNLKNPKDDVEQCLRVNKTLLQKDLSEKERGKDRDIINTSIELLKQRIGRSSIQ